VLRVANRDSATRWARHLAVQFDVGELFMFVLSRRSETEAKAEKPARRYIFFGTSVTLVGVSSSFMLEERWQTLYFRRSLQTCQIRLSKYCNINPSTIGTKTLQKIISRQYIHCLMKPNLKQSRKSFQFELIYPLLSSCVLKRLYKIVGTLRIAQSHQLINSFRCVFICC